jgi:hypothetical protein
MPPCEGELMSSQHVVSQNAVTTDEAGDAFGRIADRLGGTPALQVGSGFSTYPALRRCGRLFAMLRDGELVVRLPGSRADELVLTSSASRFYGADNARLAQWIAVPYSQPDAWIEPAQEALEYTREAVAGVGR